MGKVEVKRICKSAKEVLQTLFRGFLRTLWGAATAWGVLLSVFGFATLSAESGWTAVFDFIASCAVLCIAISNIYVMGARKRGKKNG